MLIRKSLTFIIFRRIFAYSVFFLPTLVIIPLTFVNRFSRKFRLKLIIFKYHNDDCVVFSLYFCTVLNFMPNNYGSKFI